MTGVTGESKQGPWSSFKGTRGFGAGTAVGLHFFDYFSVECAGADDIEAPLIERV